MCVCVCIAIGPKSSYHPPKGRPPLGVGSAASRLARLERELKKSQEVESRSCGADGMLGGAGGVRHCGSGAKARTPSSPRPGRTSWPRTSGPDAARSAWWRRRQPACRPRKPQPAHRGQVQKRAEPLGRGLRQCYEHKAQRGDGRGGLAYRNPQTLTHDQAEMINQTYFDDPAQPCKLSRH